MFDYFGEKQQMKSTPSIARQTVIQEFMAKPSPRYVSDEVYRLAKNPIGFFLGMMGVLAIAQVSIMTIGFTLAHKITSPIAFFICMGIGWISGGDF